jgi:hypothetical protein
MNLFPQNQEIQIQKPNLWHSARRNSKNFIKFALILSDGRLNGSLKCFSPNSLPKGEKKPFIKQLSE